MNFFLWEQDFLSKAGMNSKMAAFRAGGDLTSLTFCFHHHHHRRRRRHHHRQHHNSAKKRFKMSVKICENNKGIRVKLVPYSTRNE